MTEVALIACNPDGTYASCCPLCGQPLSQPIFATSHFIDDEKHDLWRYSDTAMHWDCYGNWPDQRRFADLLFHTWLRHAASPNTQAYWATLLATDDVLVTYGLVVNEVAVHLRHSGSELRVPRTDWPSFLAGRWSEWCRHGLEFSAIAEILPQLRELQLPERLEGSV